MTVTRSQNVHCPTPEYTDSVVINQYLGHSLCQHPKFLTIIMLFYFNVIFKW